VLLARIALSSLTAFRVMTGAADLHHAHLRRVLALFATVFTVLRRRAPACLSRTLVLVLFVHHLNQPPYYALLLAGKKWPIRFEIREHTVMLRFAPKPCAPHPRLLLLELRLLLLFTLLRSLGLFLLSLV